MSQINDCVVAALGPGQINDLLAAYHEKAPTESLNDAAYRWLGEQGATGDQLNDRWFSFLQGKGYAGSLNDMWYQFWCVDGGAAEPPTIWLAAYYDPDTYELKQEVIGVGGETCVHTADIYAPDNEGVYRAFKANEPVWEGGRVVGSANLCFWSEDQSQAGWVASGCVVEADLSNGPIVNGRQLAVSRITPDGTGRRITGTFDTIIADDNYTLSVWAKKNSSSEDKQFFMRHGVNSPTFTVTDEWVRYEHTFVGVAGWEAATRVIDIGISATPILMAGAQWNKGSMADYNKTTGVLGETAYFADDGAGVLLDPLPRLVFQKAATNELIESNTLSQWTARGTAVATDDQVGLDGQSNTASLITGLLTANAAGDVYENVSTPASPGDPIYAKIYVKRTQPTGEIFVDALTGGSGSGRWIVDMALLPDAFELIHAGHPAVTVVVPFIASETSRTGFDFRGATGDTCSSIIVGNCESHLVDNNIEQLGPIFTTTTRNSTDKIINTWAAANHSDAGQSYSLEPKLIGEAQTLLALGGTPVLFVREVV